MQLRGSIPALVTPMRNGKVDEKAFQDFVDWQIKEGSSGVVPVGTTGETPTLSHDEHCKVVSMAVEAANGRVPVIAGAGSNNTEEALYLSRYAEKAGADAVLVVTPYYNKPNARGLIAHYTAINNAINIPIIIYNIPGRSVIDMSVETMTELAKLKNIVGVKDATGNVARTTQQRQAMGADFIQLSGNDDSSLGQLAQGGHGCISVTANVAPKLCAEMQSAWRSGNCAKALALQEQLMPLHDAMFCEPSPAPAKYALSLLGKCSEEVRSPIVTLSDQGKGIVEKAMRFARILN